MLGRKDLSGKGTAVSGAGLFSAGKEGPLWERHCSQWCWWASRGRSCVHGAVNGTVLNIPRSLQTAGLNCSVLMKFSDGIDAMDLGNSLWLK